MSNFVPVATLDDLDSLPEGEQLEGYLSAERGDPEPGENRGRAFWHGYRMRMMDWGVIPIDDTHRKLVRDWLARERSRRLQALSPKGGAKK